MIEVRVGTRPSTPDGRPVIGQVPGWTNVWVATGHGAEGLLLGPLTAWMVARQVLGLGMVPPLLREGAAGRILERCSPARFVSDAGP